MTYPDTNFINFIKSLDQKTKKMIVKIFLEDIISKYKHIKNGEYSLSHYTSAEKAQTILTDKRLLLRKVTCMNDYQEIIYGKDIVIKYLFNDNKDEINSIIQSINKNYNIDNLKKTFTDYISDMENRTYICCFSEIKNKKNHSYNGDLSMWRGYANTNGVMFKFKPIILDSPEIIDNISFFISPVIYDKKDFIEILDDIFQKISDDIYLIKNIFKEHIDFFFELIIRQLYHRIICLKNKDFKEEKEWRLLYSPFKKDYVDSLSNIQSIDTEIKTFYGLPQKVHYMNFNNLDILDSIIIGPTQYPEYISTMIEAFQYLLKDNNIEIYPSTTPYRIIK
mgnify:CR=1 FL=1